MKRTFILLTLLALSLGLRAQQRDSAALIVDHYLQRLNHQALHPDSVLYIESRIYTLGQSDTLTLRRWFKGANMSRVELWQGSQLGLGFRSDGSTRQKYNAQHADWQSVDQDTYFNSIDAFDFRGPLYQWRVMGVELTYLGPIDFQGNPCWRLLVRDPARHDRYYIFSQRDGMLFFIDELETSLVEAKTPAPPVDWRAISEYVPFGASVMVRQELYQNEQGITVSDHAYRYLPFDPSIFKTK